MTSGSVWASQAQVSRLSGTDDDDDDDDEDSKHFGSKLTKGGTPIWLDLWAFFKQQDHKSTRFHYTLGYPVRPRASGQKCHSACCPPTIHAHAQSQAGHLLAAGT